MASYNVVEIPKGIEASRDACLRNSFAVTQTSNARHSLNVTGDTMGDTMAAAMRATILPPARDDEDTLRMPARDLQAALASMPVDAAPTFVDAGVSPPPSGWSPGIVALLWIVGFLGGVLVHAVLQ